MDHYSNMIKSKIQKVENALSELESEVLSATKHLLQLKENSNIIVNNLKRFTNPAEFLQEFLNVNSFILKSLSFLTEINCKFEMLDLSERKISNCITNSRAIVPCATLETMQVEKDDFRYLTIKDLESSKENDILKKIIIEKPSRLVFMNTLASVNKKKPKRKKSKKTQPHQCNIQNSGGSQTATVSDSSNYEGISFYSTQTDSKSDSDAKLNSSSSVDRDELGVTGSLDIKINGCAKDKLSNSKSSLESVFSNEPGEEKVNKISVVPETDSRKSPFSELVHSKISPYSDKSKLENTPLKIIDSDAAKYCNSTVELQDDQLKANEAINDEIKPLSIIRKLGKEYDVSIEHIKSPSEFYVSIPDVSSKLLLELEKKLKLIPANNKCSLNGKNKNKKDAFRKEVGNYALFYSMCDEMWCRAEIINWSLNFNDEFVSVFLLDYGDFKCVSVNDLKPMPDFCKKYPAFTVRCHLHDVFPIDMDPNSETLCWEKEATEKLKSLTEYSNKIKIKIGLDDSFHALASLPVTLWLVDKGNKCVNEILVEGKYAIHRVNNSVVMRDKSKDLNSQNENLNDWNPMKEDFELYQNSYDLDINDPSAIIYGYVGKDYDRICKHYAETGSCFKGAACRKEHMKLDPLGFTMDQENIYKNAFNNLSAPPPKSIIHVQITCILDFNKFFCFSSNQCTASDEENLKTLLQFMNRKENLREMKKLLIPPSAGQIVLACYSADGAWYRARILESQPEKDEYLVVFVDYGNRDVLPLSDIRAIEGRYLHLPFQAMECCISGIKQNPKVPYDEVMDYVRKKMDSDDISVEVIGCLPGENVNLMVHVFDEKGDNIADDLIAKGFAVSKEEILIDSISESVPG